MTRMSTRVGQAYVAIAADASNINNDIVDGLKKVDTKDMAKRHGKDYAKTFEKHIDSLEKSLKNAVNGMSRAITTNDGLQKAVDNMLDNSLSPAASKRTQSTWKRLFEHVGKQAGVGFGTEFDGVIKDRIKKSLRESLLEAGRSGAFSLDDVVRSMGTGNLIDLGPSMDAVIEDVKQTVTRVTEEWNQGRKRNAEIVQDFEDARRRMVSETAAINKRVQDSADAELLRSQQRLMDRLVEDWERGQESKTEALRQSLRARERAESESADTVVRTEERAANRRLSILQRLRAAQVSLATVAERSAVANQRWAARTDHLADRAGRMFGKGSRMDGIHYFGSVIGTTMKGVMGSLSLVGKSITGVSKLATSASQVFMGGFRGVTSQVEGTVGALTKLQATGAGVMALLRIAGVSVAGSMATLVGGLIAAVVATGVLTTVLSILASVLSALTALATALVGSLVAGLTAGVMVLSGALIAGAAAAGALALAFVSLNDKQKALLKGSMEPFVGTMKRIGRTMAREMAPAFETWGRNLNRFGQMMEPWAKSMGKAFGDAGKILTESFTGPGFQKLSTSLGVYLPGIIRKLSTATGDFLNGVAGMFSAVMPFVDRFATYLTQVAERFSEWANSAKGQNSISDFMNRAWTSLKSFWGALREFSGFLKDVLFNPATMRMGDGMFDSMRDSFAGFREAIRDGSLERWLEQGKEFGSALKDVLSALAGTFRSLSDSGTISNVSSTMRTFADVMRALDPFIQIAVRGVNLLYSALSNLMSIFQPSISFIGWAGEKLGFLAGGADDAAPSLGRVGDSMQIAADAARAADMDIKGLAGAFDLLGGKASESNRKMALAELEKIPGLFEQMQRFNIGRGDMISAALGDPAAIKRINSALADVNLRWQDNLDGVNLIKGAMDTAGASFAAVTREAQENAVAMGTLRDLYPQIPQRVVSKFEQQGLPETRRELRELISEIEMTPETRKLVMTIFGDKDVLRAARKAGDDIEKLPDAKIGVDADVKDAEKKASSVKKMVEKTKAIFGIGANTKPANADVKKAVSRAERFNAIFKVGANTKPANADVKKAVSQAERFNAIFKVEANTKKSEDDAIIGKKFIERLDPLFKVSAETKEAKERARSAVDTVNKMTASIKVNADMSGFNSAVANARANATVNVRTRPVGGGGGGGGRSGGGSTTAPGSVPLLPKTGPLTDGQGGRSTPFGFAADSGVRMGDVAAASAAATKAGEAVRRTVDDAFATALAKPAKGKGKKGGEKGGKKGGKKGDLASGVPAIYKEWAREILRSMPTFIDGLRSMLEGFNKAVNDTIVAAATAGSPGEVVSILDSQIDAMLSATQSQVDSARSAVASAAESLLSATTKKEAEAARKALERAQRDLDAALKAQAAQGHVAHILEQQRVVNQSVVDAIADQITTSGPSGAAKAIRDLIASDKTTLADFAAVREVLATQIQQANDALAKAIADRDAFEQAVSGSVRSFTALTTAQARVVDGVTQALTATDITDNLRDRLEKVKKYQSDLNALLALGISDDLYRQLLEAGVEVGSEYANALLEGGVGSIDEANQLVEDINAVADGLGTEAANRLHQAGIDMAEGVLEGLIQLQDQIDEAAAALGEKIAAAVAIALEDVIGNHTVPTPRPNGPRGGAAANTLAGLASSPAAAVNRSPRATVSGNDPRPAFRDLVVQTPTKDPKAVAYEVLNEVAGRL